MLGAIAAEILLHLKGMALPVVGTALAILLSMWRQKKTKGKFNKAIAEGLQTMFREMPNGGLREILDLHTARAFIQIDASEIVDETADQVGTTPMVSLEEAILLRVDEQIAEVELQLSTAIEDVEKGETDFETLREEMLNIEASLMKESKSVLQECTSLV